MTLSDIQNNPRLLAEFLNVPFEPTTVLCGHHERREITAEERVEKAFDEYRDQLRQEWARHPFNQFKTQTRTQVVMECLSKGLGITKGSVKSRIQQAKQNRPDLYS